MHHNVISFWPISACRHHQLWVGFNRLWQAEIGQERTLKLSGSIERATVVAGTQRLNSHMNGDF